MMNNKYLFEYLPNDLRSLVDAVSEDIGYEITHNDIAKYADYSLPLARRLHDTAIGVLLDEKCDIDFTVLDKLSTLIELPPLDSIIECLGYKMYLESSILSNHEILRPVNYDKFLKSQYWKLVKSLKEYENENCQLCGVVFSDTIYSNLHHNNYAC